MKPDILTDLYAQLMVGAVGLEPTRISPTDFESGASTISPRPHYTNRRFL